MTAGSATANTVVQVFEQIGEQDSIRPEQRMVAIPVHLRSGEWRRWTVRPGNWIFTMQAAGEAGPGLEIFVERAYCMPGGYDPSSTSCLAQGDAGVVVYHDAEVESTLDGTLLLWRLGDSSDDGVVRAVSR